MSDRTSCVCRSAWPLRSDTGEKQQLHSDTETLDLLHRQDLSNRNSVYHGASAVKQ